MSWSTWKLQVVILFLGGCIGGTFIKEKEEAGGGIAGAERLSQNNVSENFGSASTSSKKHASVDGEPTDLTSHKHLHQHGYLGAHHHQHHHEPPNPPEVVVESPVKVRTAKDVSGHQSESGGGGGDKPPAPAEQEEKLLLQFLMRGYERDVRPVRNASQPVVVKVGITLTQIFDMDEKNQVLTTNVWLDQEWNDELLRWDPKEFGGLEKIRIPCERIWLPDIVLYNNADDYTRGYMPSRAMVTYDGNVFWPPPTKFRSTCAVDVTYFPFDDQTCHLKLGSWTYNGDQVDVTNRTSEIDLANYVVNGEWDLLQAEITRNVVVYPCCPEQFPDVTITLVIRRKTLYYIYNIVLPCMMLSALTLLVFCLPPDSGEKIVLGITVLLAFSVFMLSISEDLPETSESIPLIGVYLTAVMAITSISVIVTVVVLNLHYLGPRVRPVPVWLKCLLPEDDVNFIRQKLLMIPNSSVSSSGPAGHHHLRLAQGPGLGSQELSTEPKYSSAYGSPASPGGEEPDLCQPSGKSVNNDKTAVAAAAAGNHSKNHSRARVRGGGGSGNGNSGSDGSSLVVSPPPTTTTACPISRTASAPQALRYPRLAGTGNDKEGGGSGGASAGCEHLAHAVRYLMSIQEQVESQNVLVAEWRLVAQAVDRILFWIVSVMTIVSSMVLLLLLPLYKRSTFYGPNDSDPDEGNSTEAFSI